MQTGTQALAAALPQLAGSAAGTYYSVQSSGHSTSNATAPKTIVAFPADTFTGLQSPALTAALQTQFRSIELEVSHNLATEGDIERAAALYLLHDVNLIIERGLFPALQIDANTLQCLGQSTTGTSRPDIKYTVNGRTVMIVEYKHTNALRDTDWTHSALVTANRTAQRIINAIPRGGQTALELNAGILSKQASKYSGQCGLVVLFNYQNMIVLDFTTGANNGRWDDLNNPVKYYFSNGTGLTHKQLLMRTFVYGMRKAGLMGANA